MYRLSSCWSHTAFVYDLDPGLYRPNYILVMKNSAFIIWPTFVVITVAWSCLQYTVHRESLGRYLSTVACHMSVYLSSNSFRTLGLIMPRLGRHVWNASHELELTPLIFSLVIFIAPCDVFQNWSTMFYVSQLNQLCSRSSLLLAEPSWSCSSACHESASFCWLGILSSIFCQGCFINCSQTW